jgi:hypothetical protein
MKLRSWYTINKPHPHMNKTILLICNALKFASLEIELKWVNFEFLCSWKHREIIFFTKLKFIIRFRNMLTHSCWCIWFTVMSGLTKILNEFKVLLKMISKMLWIKEKQNSGTRVMLKFGQPVHISANLITMPNWMYVRAISGLPCLCSQFSHRQSALD